MTKTEQQMKFIYWTVTENIKNEMFRRSSYVLLSWLLESVSFVTKAAPAGCLPGKRS